MSFSVLAKMAKRDKAVVAASWTEGQESSNSSSKETDIEMREPLHQEHETRSEWANVPPEDFMARFRDTASESLANAYLTNHPLHFSPVSGTVTSTLCEDVFYLVNTQWNVLHDYLTTSKLLDTQLGNALLIDGLLFMLRNLWNNHAHHRDNFLINLERSCATGNDFYRMMETAEEFWATLCRTYPKALGNQEDPRAAMLNRECSDLLSLYSSDAVYAVQRAHIFVVREINQSVIPSQLFNRDWEDVYTSNEVVLSLVKTIEDYLYDFHSFLCNELLYRKVVDSLIRAMVCFYVTSLVRNADHARRKKRRGFGNPPRALVRMMYDLQLFQTYFDSLTKEIPSLAPVVEEEMSVLVLLHEVLGVAVANSEAACLEEFVVVVHKQTGGNVDVTRHLLSDLLFYAAPMSQQNEIHYVISLMQADLQLVSMQMEETASNAPVQPHRDPLKGIKLQEALKDHYEERILQEQFAVCAPCVHAVKKAQKKHELCCRTPKMQKPLQSLLTTEDSLKMARLSHRPRVNLQEKLSEVLKLHNLNFVKTKPRFVFSLSPTNLPK